jgi:hypothetical protein
MLNMLPQQLASSFNVSLSAKFQNLVMLLVGPLHPVREVQLEASVALAAVVDIANNR